MPVALGVRCGLIRKRRDRAGIPGLLRDIAGAHAFEVGKLHLDLARAPDGGEHLDLVLVQHFSAWNARARPTWSAAFPGRV